MPAYFNRSQTWAKLQELNQPRCSAAVCAIGTDRLLVAGGWERGCKTMARRAVKGETRDGVAMSSVEIFDSSRTSGGSGATGTWRPGPMMCKERAGCSGVLMPHGLVRSAVVLGCAEGGHTVESLPVHQEVRGAGATSWHGRPWR